MKRNKMSRGVSVALASIAIMVMVAALPVARAMTMPASAGDTDVDVSSNCDAAIAAPVDSTSYHLGSNPDTVRMPYDLTWSDARNPALHPPTATHSFTLQTEHLGNVVSTSKTVNTNGGASGSDTIWRNVTNVYSGQYVNITFSASVSGPTGAYCPFSDAFTMYYTFVYP